MAERSKFGIQALDKALNGGIPLQNIVLVAGGAGTGKSTLSLQYLINGALLFGETGIYISTEQKEEDLYKLSDQFGWKLRDLVKSRMIKIISLNSFNWGEGFFSQIDEACESFKPKRIVVDSVTTITDSFLLSSEFGTIFKEHIFSPIALLEKIAPFSKTERLVSKAILYTLVELLKKHDSTALLTSELPEDTKTLSEDGVSEFICDGVVILEYLPLGAAVARTLRIRKMRYSIHERRSLQYEIGEKGISLEDNKSDL